MVRAPHPKTLLDESPVSPTLVAAIINSLKPYEYFEYLLSVIPQHMEETDTKFLENLLPWSETLPENIRKPKQ